MDKKKLPKVLKNQTAYYCPFCGKLQEVKVVAAGTFILNCSKCGHRFEIEFGFYVKEK